MHHYVTLFWKVMQGVEGLEGVHMGTRKYPNVSHCPGG